MSDKESLIEIKISDLLDKKYKDSNVKEGVTILSEDDNNEDKKITNEYKRCFKEVLRSYKKPLAKMSDNEKKDLFKSVNEKCKKSK